MQPYRSTGADVTKILMRRELQSVLDDLHQKAKRSPNSRLNMVLFRLATCCGLRVSEIANLKVSDLRVEVGRPHVRIRRGAAKGGRPRNVPLWWDAGTLADLAAWKRDKLLANPNAELPLVASLRNGRGDIRMSRHTLRKRFKTACKVLGPARLEALTIHHGRHTFISHALAGGRKLAEVRDAAGHANVSITSTYLHVVIDEEEEVGNLFAHPARPTLG
jgi:integrase/recombinase XerD